ncbi:histidine phosphatase superfamily [Lipomyces arxii]|uniref:histidine phosphatase superfamily n=1 Tax=Lipomyces arxii TaxID=56418 RepID=UPI0034CED071
MGLSTIYICRHGFRSNWDTSVPPSVPPTGIDGDPTLSKHGQEQAHELCEHLAAIKPPINRIYSSPFYRCLQTITELADTLDLEIYCENGVGEWYGKTRKTHPRAAPPTVLQTFFPRTKVDYEPIHVPSTSGETIEELHDRAGTVLSQMIKDCSSTPLINTIVICAHAATIIALGRALVGQEGFDVRTGTCSVSKYVAEPDNNDIGHWTCVENGAAGHLTEGEERHWTFASGNYDFLDVQAYENRVHAANGYTTPTPL